MPPAPVADAPATQSSNEPARKRRKIRRGTCSCRECKRRKIRCEFADEFPAACVSCRHRGIQCAPQEVEDEASLFETQDRYSQVEESIARVEDLLGQLVQQPADLALSLRLPAAVSGSSGSIHSGKGDRNSANQGRIKSKFRLLAKHADGQVALAKGSRDWSNYNLRQQIMPLGPPSIFSLSRLVHSYLPSRTTANQIMRQGKFRGVPAQLYRTPVKAFIKLATASVTVASEPPRLPGSFEPTARPIVLANKLLQLAICLQQMDQTQESSLLGLDCSAHDTAERFMQAASKYVTSQDSLVVSHDGLEALMLESHFHINSGNYKLAWSLMRRAMDVARLLDIHASQPSRLGGQSTGDIRFESLWFRLVYMDRYFSMMLSLPAADMDFTFENLESKETEEEEEAVTRLEHTHAFIMGRIASRNDRMSRGEEEGMASYDHYQETKDIDHELKRAARTMPVRWWTIPRFDAMASDAEGRADLVRLYLQIHQYNLLISLHGPYTVQGSRAGAIIGGSGSDVMYSKLTALSACRETILRFPVFANLEQMPVHSRGINVKVLIAAITILLAHLDDHRADRGDVLEHQRPQDLRMVDETIKSLEEIERQRPRPIDSSYVGLLKRLVEIENDAANGTIYDVWSEKPVVGEIQCSMKDVDRGLDLMVPTIGTIHVIRKTTSGGGTPDHSSLMKLNRGVSLSQLQI